MSKRNAVARDLRTPKYRKRIEVPAKGKGSYRRGKGGRRDRDGGGHD